MRNYRAKELIIRIRQLTNTTRNMAVSDEEILSYIDHNYPRTWALLASIAPPDSPIIGSATFNTVAGTKAYDLTSASIVPSQDFWKVRVVYVNEGNGELRPLAPINEFNVQAYRAPQGVYPIQLEYIKNCPEVTTYNQQIDGINGWEEHLVALCCQDVKMKLEEDPSPYIKKEQQLAAEIIKTGQRDAGYGESIVRRRHRDPYWLYRNNVDGYRLRGNSLELYYRSGYRAVP